MHPFTVSCASCSCPSGSTEHERLGIRTIGPVYNVYAQRTPGAGGLPSEMITLAIAIIRYMSGTSDDSKAAPQAREITKHRSKPTSIEGLTMEIKRERARKGLPEMTRPLMEMPDYKPSILTAVEIEENRRKRNARKRAKRARKPEAERKQIAKFGSLNYKLCKLLATIRDDSQKTADGNGAWSKNRRKRSLRMSRKRRLGKWNCEILKSKLRGGS